MKLNNVQVTYVKGCSNLQKIRKNQKCDLPNVLLNPQSLSISYHEALGAVGNTTYITIYNLHQSYY